jgi:hypothetical protein
MAGPADEALAARTPLGSTLAAGVEQISIQQTVTFTLYNRVVLPLDGYVFWVKAAPQVDLVAMGSLHYASDSHQDETEDLTINTVLFTSEVSIDDFNDVNPNQLYIGTFDGIQFAFNSRGMFYKQTQLFHYRGNATYPDMSPQVVDTADSLDPESVIVSNSLPLWLALNGFVPPNPGLGFANPVTMFPSFLVPQNIAPPWASVDIQTGPDAGLMAAPLLSSDSSHQQLVTERVKITLYGLRNDAALTFIDCVNQYSLDFDTFGIMNVPVLRDEKRTQSELSTIAQKKTVEFDISYYQFTARSVARQLIETVQETFIVTGSTPTSGPSLDFSNPDNSQYLPGLL